MDIIIRIVTFGDRTEYLPIIENKDGEEIYRGEYKETAEEALARCMVRIEGMEE